MKLSNDMKRIEIELKWALIFMLTLLFWMFLEPLLGLHDQYIAHHVIFTNFFFIPAVTVFALALRDKKKQFYGGQMTWGQGFYTGGLMTVFITILSPLGQWFISNVITPYYFSNVIEYVVGQNLMTQTDAEAYFSLKNYVFQSVVGAAVMGVVTTVIVAFFVRSKK